MQSYNSKKGNSGKLACGFAAGKKEELKIPLEYYRGILLPKHYSRGNRGNRGLWSMAENPFIWTEYLFLFLSGNPNNSKNCPLLLQQLRRGQVALRAVLDRPRLRRGLWRLLGR